MPRCFSVAKFIFIFAACATLEASAQKAIRERVIETVKTQPKNVSQNAQTFSLKILNAQIALTNRGISAGSLDGLLGGQTKTALRVFQQREKLSLTGVLDNATVAKLELPQKTPLKTIVLTAADVESLTPVPKTWLEKSEGEALGYETALELVAERSHAHPRLIQKLNPQIDWKQGIKPGLEIQVPAVRRAEPREKAARIKISLKEKTLQVFSATGALLAHFPCSIAARVEKRPVGELKVANFAQNPNYTFDAANFPESEEAKKLNKKLILPPGANNPVGLVWIGLNLTGYGIHGTPAPEEIGRTSSHGCFRLTNWDAQYLLKLVKVGTPVLIENG